MIESVQFRNFKVLRNTTLPLGRFTLIVGPNGSGKSTALQALQACSDAARLNFYSIATAGLRTAEPSSAVELVLRWKEPNRTLIKTLSWSPEYGVRQQVVSAGGETDFDERSLNAKLAGIRIYSLDANAIAARVHLQPSIQLQQDGRELAGVLDRLRDEKPERFEALNQEFGRWLPEFDRILFDTPEVGARVILLRTREGRHAIPAKDLSQGTLLALAILTLAYIAPPPPIVCLEEPDRGIHPRLLREVQDAIYRLSFPENFGERREPSQVVATTHSPYFLDLYREHPEEIVIAQKMGQEAWFERLVDRPDVDEILRDAHLGDMWYSGILGGVPSVP